MCVCVLAVLSSSGGIQCEGGPPRSRASRGGQPPTANLRKDCLPLQGTGRYHLPWQGQGAACHFANQHHCLVSTCQTAWKDGSVRRDAKRKKNDSWQPSRALIQGCHERGQELLTEELQGKESQPFTERSAQRVPGTTQSYQRPHPGGQKGKEETLHEAAHSEGSTYRQGVATCQLCTEELDDTQGVSPVPHHPPCPSDPVPPKEMALGSTVNPAMTCANVAAPKLDNVILMSSALSWALESAVSDLSVPDGGLEACCISTSLELTAEQACGSERLFHRG